MVNGIVGSMVTTNRRPYVAGADRGRIRQGDAFTALVIAELGRGPAPDVIDKIVNPKTIQAAVCDAGAGKVDVYLELEAVLRLVVFRNGVVVDSEFGIA